MRETAIMDFLTHFREDGSDAQGAQGGWVPTAEKVIGAEAWDGADALASEAPAGGESSFLSGHASRFEPPATPFRSDPASAAPASRPPGFGPPARAGGAVAGGPPVLSPEDLQALEELAIAESTLAKGAAPSVPRGPALAAGAPVTAPAPAAGAPVIRAGVAPASRGPVDTWPPGATVTVASSPDVLSSAPGIARPAVQPMMRPAPVGREVAQPSAVTDRARIVQPIPTWPPPGASASWSTPDTTAKNIGPVPSRHRPDARRTARRRAALAVLVVVLAAVVAWLLVVKHEHPGRLAHLAPPLTSAVFAPGPAHAVPSGGRD